MPLGLQQQSVKRGWILCLRSICHSQNCAREMMFYRRCRHECHAHCCRAVCSDRQGTTSLLSADNKLWWYDSHWQSKCYFLDKRHGLCPFTLTRWWIALNCTTKEPCWGYLECTKKGWYIQLPRKVGKSGSKLTQAAAAARWPLLCGGIWGWINKFDKFNKFSSTFGRLVPEHASWHTHRRRLGFEMGDLGVEILETLSKARNNVFSYVFICFHIL